MPKRFITYSRTEPARTILFITANLTWIMQTLFVAMHFSWAFLPNLLVVLLVSGWAVVASRKNNVSHMSMSSFWLFVVWLWSSLSRLAFSPDPASLLWMPMLTIAMALAVVYVHLAHQKRQGF